MTVQFDLTTKKFNTQYAPLGLLLAIYKEKQVLKPLEKVKTMSKVIDFSMIDKLQQVLVSILAGCDTISEVNTQLKGDPLSRTGSWIRFADQSTLSLALAGCRRSRQIEQIMWRKPANCPTDGLKQAVTRLI